MTFSKKDYSTPLHFTHSTQLFKIFFSLLTLSTAFLQKASGPGKNKSVKLQNVVNKIDRDDAIGKQYKEFFKKFRNIPGHTNILYDYETYKNLVLDRINNDEVSTSNDDSFIKKGWKRIY